MTKAGDGGPATLRCVSEEEALAKYEADVISTGTDKLGEITE